MTRREIIKVGGMSCVRCSAAVENALKAQNGVSSASVSYANGRAEVCFDDGLVSLKQLEKAIKNAGYTVVQDIRTAQKQAFRTNLWLFLISLLLSLPFFVMMGAMMLGNHLHFMEKGLLQLLLATPIQFLCGFRFYKGAYHSLKNKSPSMDVLVALGTTVSYFYSVYSLLTNGDSFYFESSAMIITLVLLGKTLESRARAKMSESIQKLMDLTPKTARVLRDGTEIEIEAWQIQKGDMVSVRPGEAVPADGIVVEGESFVDESALTGESMPVSKREGSKVLGGSVNRKGYILFRADNVGEETVLASVIRLVEEAQSSKARVQTVADKVSSVFVPTVMGIALVTFAYFFLGAKDISSALDNAVAVLVIACPCSLGLATPTALMVGMGRGASMGILIKNADALEQACKIKALVLDKTGTVTEGNPRVVEVVTLSEITDSLLLTASAEAMSEHPIGEVIASEFKGELTAVDEFQSVTGKGILASVMGKDVAVGKASWIEEYCQTKLPDFLGELSQKGTLAISAIDKIPALAFVVSDPLRKDSEESLKRLKSMGIHTFLVTGDNSSVAKRVADQIGTDEFYADALPEDKVDKIKETKEKYGVTAMIGDGINDSPALTASDIGFAVGNGTDIAMESGDIILVSGGISAVADAISLSRATMRKIKQNLFWAFFYNALALPLAALGLLNPIIAGGAMAFSSVSVVTNSLLLRRSKLN